MVLDPLALGVEQVGDAMQRHHGFAGARAAFDHQHPGMIQPDDLVLFGLNRRDDVAHTVTPWRVDRGEQCRVRGEDAVASLCTVGTAEDLVGEVDEVAPTSVELAAPTHVFGAGGGGDVERARCRRPPVEQQRFVLVRLVEDADPADVGTVARKCVQPAETQPVVRHVQPLRLSGQRTHLGIPLHQRPAILEVDGTPQRCAVTALYPRALGVEPGVQLGHVGLL